MMSPKIDTIEYSAPDQSTVDQAAAILDRGGLIVAPTETRYGLLARADDREAVSRLYGIKGRPMTMPTAIFVKDVNGISRYGRLNAAARRLAEKFLPGPLTLVLEATASLGEPLVVDRKIGIRLSSAPFIQSLVETVKFPVTATSANISGDQELETIEEIARAFGGKIDLYVDVGVLDNPVSTVVDASEDNPVILRSGAIAESEILALLDSQLI
ncbi:MAG: threonylcarbamoyl-AMP synthase [Candidatus Zixiibacteriota bacterium]|nr:MAG: threonylcarbamoyl-AMP synthase [candidate division Zixibacteria bacterium]